MLDSAPTGGFTMTDVAKQRLSIGEVSIV